MSSDTARATIRKSILFHYGAMAINAATLVAGILLVFSGGEGRVQAGIFCVAGGTVAFLVLEGAAVRLDRRAVELMPNVPAPNVVSEALTLEGELRIRQKEQGRKDV